jgi:hypothetical protein
MILCQYIIITTTTLNNYYYTDFPFLFLFVVLFVCFLDLIIKTTIISVFLLLYDV